MAEKLYILFCESPFESNQVDPDYEGEFFHAKQNGFGTLLFNFEDLTSSDRFQFATRKIKQNEALQKVIYRGWMLTPKQYQILYTDLLLKNFELINSAEQYQSCHYLPDSLTFIADYTPKTIFKSFEDKGALDEIIQGAEIFGHNPVIIKDYVKSEKHDWETACLVSDASNTEKLKQTIENLIALRGKHLNEGIVIREFISLNDLTIHSKSGMPLTEEYRLFFFNKKLVDVYDYWEEGEYKHERPNTTEFEKIASQIDSHFFTMDIARKKNGELIIIELGDGQVAGLPEKTDRNDFYKKLKHYS